MTPRTEQNHQLTSFCDMHYLCESWEPGAHQPHRIFPGVMWSSPLATSGSDFPSQAHIGTDHSRNNFQVFFQGIQRPCERIMTHLYEWKIPPFRWKHECWKPFPLFLEHLKNRSTSRVHLCPIFHPLTRIASWKFVFIGVNEIVSQQFDSWMKIWSARIKSIV